ncbi:MFS transporter [Tumebacillus sp. ITR2]|uniref:MFS transporter n=1 Tax=Tumebacillus amylolyticus TaxID=2801339 RepID=A0ABS1J538_9BACL|nr:MFS transporter [Tumebacillus amylolyticus]MBL0385144.1 MFS transporter [Tumebacillus amylolyticus]
MNETKKSSNIIYLLISQFLSEIGDWITAGTVALLIFKATSNPLLVSLIMITENLAIILFSTVAGAVADRVSPKKLMVMSDLVRAGCVALIPVVSANFWWIYLLLIVQVSFSCFFFPAKQKVILQSAATDQLATFNSWSFGISGFVRIIGTMSAGLFVGMLGYNVPFLIDAVSYLLSAILMVRIAYTMVQREPETAASEETPVKKPSIFQDIAEGVREVRKISAVPKLLFIFTMGSFLMGLFIPQLVVFNATYLGGDEFQYGLLNATIAVGTLATTFVFPKFVQKWNPYNTMTYTTFAGLGLVLLSMTFFSMPVTFGVLFLFGVFQTAPNLVATTLTQQLVPEALIGRFFGLLNIFTTTCYVTGMLVGGLVASASITWLYRGAGLFALTAFLVTLIFGGKMKEGVQYERGSA